MGIQNALTEVIKNSWLNIILQVAGEQRNSKAWSSYWNKIPKDVINSSNMNYVIYASADTNFPVKLDNNLVKIHSYNTGYSTTQGVSVDISDKYLYMAENGGGTNNGPGGIFKYNKTNNNLLETVDISNQVNSITYAPDNFLYVSTKAPSIEKWDPISMTKLKENTDAWLINVSYTYYDLDPAQLSTTTSTSSNFNSFFDSTLCFDSDGDGTREAGSGTWNFPLIGFWDGTYSSRVYNPNGNGPTVTIMPKPTNLDAGGGNYTGLTTTNPYALTISGTFKVRDTSDTYRLIINKRKGSDANNGVEFSINGSVITQLSDKDNAGFHTKTGVSLSDGDTFQIRIVDANSSDVDAFWFVYHKDSESFDNTRPFPVFNGAFGYLNYDPSGTLYAQNNYGIFKWDAMNMICQEAQPVENTNSNKEINDVCLDNSFVYATSNITEKIYKINKNTLKKENESQDGHLSDETLHFNANGQIITFDWNSSNPTLIKIDTATLTIQQRSNVLPLAPRKITITPNDFIYVGYDGNNTNGDIRKYNSDLTDTGKSYSLGSFCTGLVYDVE